MFWCLACEVFVSVNFSPAGEAQKRSKATPTVLLALDLLLCVLCLAKTKRKRQLRRLLVLSSGKKKGPNLIFEFFIFVQDISVKGNLHFNKEITLNHRK